MFCRRNVCSGRSGTTEFSVTPLIVTHIEIDAWYHDQRLVTTNKEGTLGLIAGWDEPGVYRVRAFRIGADYGVELGPESAVPPSATNALGNLSPTYVTWVYPNVALCQFSSTIGGVTYNLTLYINESLALSFYDETPLDGYPLLGSYYGEGNAVVFYRPEHELYAGFINAAGALITPFYDARTLPAPMPDIGDWARISDSDFYYLNNATSGTIVNATTASVQSDVPYEYPPGESAPTSLYLGKDFGSGIWHASDKFLAVAYYLSTNTAYALLYHYDADANSMVLDGHWSESPSRHLPILLGNGISVGVTLPFSATTIGLDVVFDQFGTPNSFTVTPPTNGTIGGGLARARDKGFLVVTDSYISGPSYLSVIYPGATTGLPPLRQFPRDDGLGASPGLRQWPPPRSLQRGTRRGGSTYP